MGAAPARRRPHLAVMPSRARLPFAPAVVLAFVGGVLFASALDWTRRVGAQGGLPGGPASRDVAAGFAGIAERVTPAVVSIQTEIRPRARALPPGHGRIPPGFEEYFHQFQQQDPEPERADGSGFLVSRDGYILTNNHVVGDADRVTVTLTDHRAFRARVVGGDPSTDVAVIKIDGANLPTAVLGEDSTARVGDWVVAVGNPLGLDFTVTAGIVSAKGRSRADLPGLIGGSYSITDFLQTDAAINPGNSGGPLVNTRGEVIGINSAIASRTGFFSGYGFAIPISLARSVMDDLVKHGRVRAPVLGVAIDEVSPADAQVAGLSRIAGVLVRGFSPAVGSPAERAGLEVRPSRDVPDDEEALGEVLLDTVIAASAKGLDAERARLEHIRRDPRISLTVLAADNWYTHVSVQGRAGEIVDDEGLRDIDRLSTHYTGRPYGNRERPRVSLHLHVERWHGWSGGRAIGD